MYLDRTDDYPADDYQEGQPDEEGNQSHGQSKPSSANSELVFGGVDQKYYRECLTWHALGQFQYDDGATFKGYWDFKLDKVLVGGTEMPSSNLALVDSGSTVIVGPRDAIGAYAEVNMVACFDLSNPDQPEEVYCDDPNGWDAAAVDCQQPLFSLDFVADGTTYSLEKEDLLIEVETTMGPICFLRIAGDDIPAWVLGDAFLTSHYAAFDFGQNRVGFAPLAKGNSGEYCEADRVIDVTNTGKEANSNTSIVTPPPTSIEPIPAPVDPVPTPLHPAKTPPPHHKSSSYTPSPNVNINTSSSTTVNTTSNGDFSKVIGAGVLIVIVGLIVMVVVSRRRRNRYHRYDQYINDNLELQELPQASNLSQLL